LRSEIRIPGKRTARREKCGERKNGHPGGADDQTRFLFLCIDGFIRGNGVLMVSVVYAAIDTICICFKNMLKQ
jgi:hypothetical protein